MPAVPAVPDGSTAPPIAVPRSFREMPRWWHEHDGVAWLDRLPALVAEQCRRWALTIDGPALHGSNALVVPVLRGETEAAALRLSPPTDDLGDPVAALRHWDGRGVVRLLEVDDAAGALLLERLDHTRTLGSVPAHEAVATLGSLARTLAVPAPPTAPSTAEVAARSPQELTAAWERCGEPTPRAVLDDVVAAAVDLATSTDMTLSVDGDLHSEQVLASHDGWRVVDPVLLRGDVEHDLGRVLWTRLDELDDAGVATAFAAFVAAAGVPTERARAWVLVRSMSYLLWGLERGLTEDPPRCRRLLALVR